MSDFGTFHRQISQACITWQLFQSFPPPLTENVPSCWSHVKNDIQYANVHCALYADSVGLVLYMVISSIHSCDENHSIVS